MNRGKGLSRSRGLEPSRRAALKPNRQVLARISQKRAEQRADFEQHTRPEYMTAHPVCQRCEQAPSSDLHHRNGTDGRRLNDARYFAAVCRSCHDHIHANPDESYEDGWLIRKNGGV